MRRIGRGAIGGMIGYTALLVAVEARQGAAVVRMYLEDPPGPVLFGHVNTALSAGLLIAVAVTFAAAWRLEAKAGRLPRFFVASQVAFFLLLAADERFRLLPAGARALGVEEIYLYAVAAAAELGLLLGPGQLLRQRGRVLLVGGAGALFLVSSALDLVPYEFRMRHAAEELPKVWSVALLLVFAWRRLEDALAELSRVVHPDDVSRAERRATRPASPAFTGPVLAKPSLPGRAPKHRAPARRADAPESEPRNETVVSSAAPPRKLLSH